MTPQENQVGQHPRQESDRPRTARIRDREKKALRTALLVTASFMVIEFFGGLWTNSLALIADSGHMLTDVGALSLALFAAWFVSRPATPQKTYGYFRAEVLAALLNGIALLIISSVIAVHAWRRLLEPQEVLSFPMLLIATAGLCANLFCVWILHADQKRNLNVRGAFLHVLGDLLGSLGAITAGLAMLFFQMYWFDPLASGLICALIAFNALRLIRDAVRVLLEATPAHVDISDLKREFLRVPGVDSVHDLHVWTLTPGFHAMTCHAVVQKDNDQREILERLDEISRARFQIEHTTIQLEREDQCCSRPRHCH